MNDNKLNRKLVIESALPKEKKKGNGFFTFILVILLLALIAFVVLEYLGYINYLDFIQMKDYDINKLISNMDFESNSLIKVNDKLYLTNYQIDVLRRNNINPENYSSLKSIIYLAEEAYEDTLDEELDVILNELVERNYYENTNK